MNTAAPPGSKSLLHVGCGYYKPGKLPRTFAGPEWREIRFDIDPAVKPDIIGTVTDMSNVEAQSVDAVWSSHNIEHVFAHEVQQVLGEFMRVLKPGGVVAITCPDLQAIAANIATGDLTAAVYMSPSGPVTSLDILFGHGPSIAAGQVYMAHKTGFTRQTLEQAVRQAGFSNVHCYHGDGHDLFVTAFKPAKKLAPV